MSIVTCTAKTRNDLSVARIVIEVLAQSWGYKCSVTYNEGKSFDIMVPAGAEENAIQKFKRLAPDLDIYKSDKKAMATAQTESRRRMKRESAFKPMTKNDHYGFDASENAEILNSDIGDFIYDPEGDDGEQTSAELIDDNYNTASYYKSGDHREEAEDISKMSFEDAKAYCNNHNWIKVYG